MPSAKKIIVMRVPYDQNEKLQTYETNKINLLIEEMVFD